MAVLPGESQTTAFLLVFLLVTIVTVTCGDAAAQQGSQCAGTSTIKVVLNSHYNRTGHWQSQVEFVQSQNGSNESGQWQTAVEQSTQNCGDHHSLRTVMYLTVPSAPSSEPGPPSVPAGYAMVTDVGVVKRSTVPKSLAEATADCARDSAVLLSIETEAKLKYAADFLNTPGTSVNASNGNDIWTGVSLQSGVWKTARGVPVSQLPAFKWMSGRPVPGEGDGCTVFAKQSLGHWDSGSCGRPQAMLPYICDWGAL